MSDRYALVGETKVTPELDDLASRRTQPLLNTVGVQTRSIAHLLKEVWLIGVKDGAAGCGKET